MGIFSKVVDFVSGDVLKNVSDLVTAYIPPGLTAVQKQEFEHKLKELMVKSANEAGTLANETLSLELSDIQDARKNNHLSPIPAWIVAATTAMIIGIYASLIFAEIPPSNREIIIQLNGIIQGVWGSAIAYFVGTTRSSSLKNDIISKVTG